MKINPNSLYKYGILEFLLIFLFVFMGNNYYPRPEKRILADGEGYHDYLKSSFIFHDLDRKDLKKDSEVYERLQKYGFYLEYKEGMVNKYTCGTAVLQLPFFWMAYLEVNDQEKITGEEEPFQYWAFYAGLFYAFFGLLFLRLAFLQFNLQPLSIVIVQAAILLATSYTHELNYGVSGSHIYSFFAISAFLYFSRRYFKEQKIRLFYFACLALGFILIIRQINILVLLFLPVIAGDWKTLKMGMLRLFKPLSQFVIGLGIIFLVGLFQVYFWYQQTGDPIVYSYGSEKFFFSYPHISEMLFSYRRSLFVYAPISIVSFLGSFHLMHQKKYFQLISWWVGFLVLTYVFSCWWDWTYGASYGQRVFIDFYPILFLMIAFYLKFIGKLGQIVFIGLLTWAVFLNTTQIYQWKKYIIDFHFNTEEKYDKVFLKTDKKYEGLFFQLPDKLNDLQTTKEFKAGSIELNESGEQLAFEIVDSTGLDYTQFICLEFESDFPESSDAEITVAMEDLATSQPIFWAKKPMIHFAKKSFDEQHKGYYLFGCDLAPTDHPILYRVFIHADADFHSAKNLELKTMKKQ
ncbi:MAG: hypothetical protein R2799_08320 [Crocinitomicaceae bacterium]